MFLKTQTQTHTKSRRDKILFLKPPKGDKQLVKAARRGGKGRPEEELKEKGQTREERRGAGDREEANNII